MSEYRLTPYHDQLIVISDGSRSTKTKATQAARQALLAPAGLAPSTLRWHDRSGHPKQQLIARELATGVLAQLQHWPVIGVG